jgi:(E)-4-hydroxy-3-methylbut-2-enyl-diphosphate synthase
LPVDVTKIYSEIIIFAFMPVSEVYRSSVINIGSISLGGDEPVRIQSMTNTSTADTEASYRQVMALYEAGCELARLTARNVREAENLGNIRTKLENAGVFIPLVADIHFNPQIAEVAAGVVHKIRINPGNYIDSQYFLSRSGHKKNRKIDQKEREEAVIRLIEICQRHQTAIRVGVNHGSLSERIMNQYGNTAEGMVASAMEFLEICQNNDFNRLVVSLKSSHVQTMIRANLRIVEAMRKKDMSYPVHLGVTEAGEGLDGRIRSAAGIGPLLALGIGDTIRVSLTEDPVAEIPVARKLVDLYPRKDQLDASEELLSLLSGEPALPRTRYGIIGGDHPPAVIGSNDESFSAQEQADLFVQDSKQVVDARGNYYNLKQADDKAVENSLSSGDDSEFHECAFMISGDGNQLQKTLSLLRRYRKINTRHPWVVKLEYQEDDQDKFLLGASSALSLMMMAGLAEGYWLTNKGKVKPGIVFVILQATAVRISGTEYISCPGCGRTSFDIQSTLRKVKEHTGGMKNTRIAVMGCIVNGPGEMAGADYGYVGEGNGRISLYHHGNRIKKGIPEEDAIKELLKLIKKDDA